jgi:hypothetical protein
MARDCFADYRGLPHLHSRHPARCGEAVTYLVLAGGIAKASSGRAKGQQGLEELRQGHQGLRGRGHSSTSHRTRASGTKERSVDECRERAILRQVYTFPKSFGHVRGFIGAQQRRARRQSRVLLVPHRMWNLGHSGMLKGHLVFMAKDVSLISQRVVAAKPGGEASTVLVSQGCQKMLHTSNHFFSFFWECDLSQGPAVCTARVWECARRGTCACSCQGVPPELPMPPLDGRPLVTSSAEGNHLQQASKRYWASIKEFAPVASPGNATTAGSPMGKGRRPESILRRLSQDEIVQRPLERKRR